MSDLRTATVLFTDIEGSTSLWEREPDRMKEAVAVHFDLLGRAIEGNGGEILKHTGDGVLAAFDEPGGAARAAAAAQRELSTTDFAVGPVKVRMGLHTGECTYLDGDLYGRTVNKAARIEQAAWGSQVLLSATTADMIRDRLDDGLSLAYLGEHHFDGILDAERVFQLSIEGVDTDHPPLRARDIGLEQLPLELTPLIGRGDEVVAIHDRLRTSRLVTLVGPPGVGKSRLSLRVATEASRERRSGVRLIDLAPCRREDAVQGLVADGVGVLLGDESSYLDGLVRALRASDTLVVLDNCEHVLDVVAELVAALAQACPGVTFLAASRERLRLPIEVVVPIDPLAVPESAQTMEALRATPSGQLLLERLTAAGLSAHVEDDADAELLSRLCRRCDGLPLALELAAAGLESMSPLELVEALESSIGVLGPREGRTSWGRHAGLRDTLDASYLALSEPEQQLLDEMAGFAGFVSVETIGEVCSPPSEDVRTLLDGLVRRSLVVTDRGHGRRRYRLLESIRQYAMEHGRVDDALRLRHAHHFVTLAEQLAEQFRTDQAREAARTVDDHFDDLRLAVNRLMERGALDEATRLVVALHEPCMFALRVEHYVWAQTLWDLVDPMSLEAARLGGTLAMALWFRGEHERALAVGQQALQASAACADPVLTIWVHNALMNAAGFSGDLDAVIKHLIALLRECREAGTPYWDLNANATQAVALAVSGDHERALPFANRSIAIAEALRHPDGIAWAYYSLAESLRSTDLDGADVALDRALASARSCGGRWTELLILMAQLTLKAERGDRTGVTTALEVLANLERAGGRAQLWEAVLLSCRMLIDAGRLHSAASLLTAITDRPQQPRDDPTPMIERLKRQVAESLDASERSRAEAEGRYLTEPEIVGRCRGELEALLGAWAEGVPPSGIAADTAR